jgi:DNA-directed RNA polymerase specialized sigma24 family protein
MKKSLKIRELEILARAKRLDEDRVDGGTTSPEQQKVIEDREYRRLSRIVDTITDLISKLPDYQKEAVHLVYFLEMNRTEAGIIMHCSNSTVRNWCIKAIEFVSPKLLRLVKDVDAWRVQEFS